MLRELGVPVPRVYACQIGTLESPVSYLLMEFVEGVPLNQAKKDCTEDEFDHLQMHLAELFLALHGNTHETYTRLTEGDREEFTSWPRFYRSLYETQCAECTSNAQVPVKARRMIGKVHEKLDRLLDHDDCPRLVHGDVWATNVLCKPDEHGKWWVTGLVDPNCKYAHWESELAYMDLFQTSTPAFLRAYQQTRRLSPEYHRLRKHIYQLYELMNHLQGFGNEYLKPLLAMVEKVSSVV
jgi:fructosamine-3-kinase